jgi:hypothetical protein
MAADELFGPDELVARDASTSRAVEKTIQAAITAATNGSKKERPDTLTRTPARTGASDANSVAEIVEIREADGRVVARGAAQQPGDPCVGRRRAQPDDDCDPADNRYGSSRRSSACHRRIDCDCTSERLAMVRHDA